MQSKTGDIPDIWALQTRLLQDLMYLALTSSGVDNSWVATYHSLLLQKEHGPFGSAFTGPLERISRVGVRDFSVDDMDVSVICRVLNSKKIRMPGKKRRAAPRTNIKEESITWNSVFPVFRTRPYSISEGCPPVPTMIFTPPWRKRPWAYPPACVR